MSEVLDNLQESARKETTYLQVLWNKLSMENPALRDVITREASAMYPEDLEAREKAIRLSILTAEATTRPGLIAPVEVIWSLPSYAPPVTQPSLF